jgi:hypothetical protein
MLSEDRSFDDGVLLARSVRALASLAGRTLSRPASPSEVGDLLEAIDRLEGEARVQSSKDLSRWLASLRKRVEDHSLVLA